MTLSELEALMARLLREQPGNSLVIAQIARDGMVADASLEPVDYDEATRQ